MLWLGLDTSCLASYIAATLQPRQCWQYPSCELRGELGTDIKDINVTSPRASTQGALAIENKSIEYRTSCQWRASLSHWH